MTELELYKYVHDNDIEWHTHNNEGTEDVCILPYIFHLEEFTKLIKSYFDEAMDIKLLDGYVAIWMKDICDYYGIEMDNVFKGSAYDN